MRIGPAARTRITRPAGTFSFPSCSDNHDVVHRMLKKIMQQVSPGRFPKPRALICVSSTITQVERRALERAAKSAVVEMEADLLLYESLLARARITAGLL